MDGHDFDQIIRRLAEAGSRRTALKRLGLGTLAGVFGIRAVDAEAKKRSGKGAGKNGGQGRNKVTICHKPGTKAEKTMRVPQSAVDGHLGHGDTMGACGGDTPGCGDGPACTGDTTCIDGACCPNDRVCGEVCLEDGQCCTDADCETGETCEDNVCVAPEVCDPACSENATCVDGVCICDEGFKPDPETGTCIPDDTGECPGKCFFIRAREACFTCPQGSKATSRGTCRCQSKARTCQRLFGGKRVRPVRCQNG